MHFWTKAEFEQFITAVQDKAPSYAAFMTLYYTGMRVGELCALTPADINLVNNTININKTFQRINGRDVIWPPKTPKSNRIVTIPQTLANCLKDYIKNVMKYSLMNVYSLIPKVSSTMKCFVVAKNPVLKNTRS